MIRSFRNKQTQDIFNGDNTRLARQIDQRIWARARELIDMLDNASHITDMAIPASNRLHPLCREREGQYAVRINLRYRLCFRWTPDGPEDVEIVDYHL